MYVDSNIQTITLQTGSGPEVGEMVQATGWGRDSDAAGGISEVLREVSVPVMSNEDCDAVYSVVNDGHICIDSKGGKGTCNVRFYRNVNMCTQLGTVFSPIVFANFI